MCTVLELGKFYEGTTIFKEPKQTRIHSSRMRTTRSLPYFGGGLSNRDPPDRDPPWTETLQLCDLWCMLGQRPRSREQNDTQVKKKYLAVTSLRAVNMQKTKICTFMEIITRMIALSAVQSCTQTLIHNAILSIDTSTMPDTIKFIL